MLSLFASKSSKDEWVATGAAPPRAFAWFVQQVSFPHFSSDVVGRVLALALPLLDQVTPATQVVGLSLLHHLLKHGTATDIRWYSDLLVHEMEQTLTTAATSASFLDATLACLEDLLAVLSPSKQDVTLYDRYFPSLLRQWDMSLDVAVKTVFTAHVRVWVARLGAPHSLQLLRYLQPLVKVTLGCVESAERTLSLEALKTLQAVIVAAWIRMPGHAEHITLAILKCLAYVKVLLLPLPNASNDHMQTKAAEHITAQCHATLYLLDQATAQETMAVRVTLQHVTVGCPSLAPICDSARQYLDDKAAAAASNSP
ncbi:hypothetical protein DYB37_008667 [Aphanomyces astaci]|uniref:Uncharacterized protein n=1 Tax=Aphanomyces astaci TaxID=112090 RepID=A0A3R7ASE9_APHAT|nr:hypothetical protein DYB35_008919 [Aphanomyces astaci]RHZ15799.1 hypothetical protein DYB37_008667 [Aphanomyces astaci]